MFVDPQTFREVDLVAILNSASSGDSTSLHSAASTIDTLLTDDPFLLTELCKCLFSPQPSLLPGGCLLGLVYLKNAVSSSSSWSQIGRPQQIGLKVALINHLQTNPPPNRLLAEIFSSVFRHEWCSDRWPEDLWNAALLSECRLPLRLCIKRAAALRLSARRREVAAHVAAILPQFISVWFATDVAEALRLTYTCITSLDQSTSREILSIQAALTERLIHHALSRLVCLNNPQDKWIAKLLHALFCILPTGLRSANALYTFKVLANVVWSTQLDPKAITWTLALMCNLLSAASSKDPCDDSSRFPSLHPEARQQIHEWLVSESGGNLYPSNAFKILSALMINWLPLKPAQVDALFTDPESSYSCGGVGCDEESLFAVEVWDSDGVIPSAHFISIGCDPQPHLRQTAEAVYHLVVGHLGKHASLLNTLRTSLQTYHANNEDPMAKELALRCAQLAMCDFEPAHAAKLAETIDGFVALDSTSSPVNTCASLALYCRQLVLLVRRAVYVTEEQPSDNSEGVLRDRCTLALWRIIPFLGFACDSKVHSLGVRLAAAHCLHWLMEHHNFQPDSLLSVLPKVSEALGSLAQDVRDSETRILIVGHVRSVLVNASIEEHPDLFMHVIDLLDRLWQVGSVSTAVRATILDLIAYLMCGLNASPESVPVCNPTGLAARLRDKVVEVVAIDLMRFVRTGEIGVDVDRDVDASVLVEPCLDLWHALVAGPGAAWSPALDHLMPVLTGDFEAVIGQPPPSPRKSLYGKIETTTQAVFYFDIALHCLRLASNAAFLSRWTEPFWSLFLTEAVMENVATAKFNDAVVPSGPNSDLVLKQLSLLSVWMSRLIAERVAISPSATGLLLLHSRLCLQAPIEVHDDSAFNSNQLRLLILAQLACSLDYWPYLLRLLQLTLTDPTKDVNFGVECARLANEPIGACGGGAFVCSPPPIEAFLARLLARADALSNRLYRRCFATASLFCLNHLPLCDKLHTDYLGAITSLCVQVLYEAEESVVEGVWTPPKAVATPTQTVESFRSLFEEWKRRLGGGNELALRLLTRHVDPVVFAQFQEKLS